MGPVEINIGSKIKKLRLARGLRQQDVARMTDLSLSMISQVENNRVSPSIATLKKIELMWNVIKTGGAMETPYVHEGEECGVVIQGRLEFTIGNQTCVLEEGDSISFDSSIPHRWRNLGDKDVHVVWAITPPTL